MATEDPDRPVRVRRRRFRHPPPRRRLTTRTVIVVLLVIAAVALITVILGATRARRAAEAGVQGKQALAAAEDLLAARDVDGARRHLAVAEDAFARMRGEIAALGPLLPLARVTPFV